MSEDKGESQDQNQDEIEEIPIVDVEQLNQDLPDEYAGKKAEDEEGGLGSVYKVAKSSYAKFKKAVLGKGYDIDNYYGWQCWDGAALLWQQYGLHLVTGNGLAIGCWDLKRNLNKYNKFKLITKVADLKKGDVVCMRPNHIGFFDGFDGGYMRILGQNQGGKSGPNGGMAFNIVKITKSAFAGAFRLEDWHKKKPKKSKPAPKPKKQAKKSNNQIAKEVLAGKWGNAPARKKRLTKAGYNYRTIQTIVNRIVKQRQNKKPVRYIVRKGDNLSKIAARKDVTTARLIKKNKGRYPSLAKNPNYIKPGWVFEI